jgi:hypothetical protein
MDHLPPEIMIGAPPNAAEPGFSAGGVLTRDKAYPSGKLASGAKMAAIVNCGDERRCDDRADAWQPREPPASFIRPADNHKLPIKLLEPELEAGKLLEHIVEERTSKIRQFSIRDSILHLR